MNPLRINSLAAIINGAVLLSAVMGCSSIPATPRKPIQSSEVVEPEHFVATPSRIDRHIESASIEDYIIALPKYMFHEESEPLFWRRVRTARKVYEENKGKGRDYLYLGGGGVQSPQDFTLDRATRTLTSRYYNWEFGLESIVTICEMRRVAGGWMMGPKRNVHRSELGAAQDIGR